MSTPGTEAMDRANAHRRANGQFGPQHHAEVDVDLDTDQTPGEELDLNGMDVDAYEELTEDEREKFIDQICSHIPGYAQSVYIDYRDKLSDEQVDMILAGRDDEAYEDVEHFFDDAAHAGEREIVSEALSDAGCDLIYSDLDYDDYDLIVDYIRDVDSNKTAYDQLMDARQPTLTRSRLGEPLSYTEGNSFNDSDPGVAYQARVDGLRARMAQFGLDPDLPENVEAAEYMVSEGPDYWHEGVTLDVIVQAERPKDLAPAYGRERKVRIQDPHLLLIDPTRGTGADAKVRGDLVVPIDSSETIEEHSGIGQRFFRDGSGSIYGGGYGWDDTAGVIHSAYAADITDVEDTDDEEQA